MRADAIILDLDFSLTCLIDTYFSFIWTEEYLSNGEFELKIPMNIEAYPLIAPDMYVCSNESDTVMVIDSVAVDSTDGDIAVIKGRTLETILERKIAWNPITLSGGLQNGIKKLLEVNVINPDEPKRAIPNFHFVESTDPEILKLKMPTGEDGSGKTYYGDNLYDILHELCDPYDLAFKVTLSKDNHLYFSLYYGVDRSYSQEKTIPVVFSRKYENVFNTNYFSSIITQITAVRVVGEHLKSGSIVGTYSSTGGGFSVPAYGINGSAPNVTENYDDVFEFTRPVDSGIRRREAIVESGVSRDRTGIAEAEEWIQYLLERSENVPDEEWESNWADKIREAREERKALYQKMEEEYHERIVEFVKNYFINEGGETIAFDAELDPYRQFIYGEEYFLGDIVQVEDGYGNAARCRIAEVSFAHDESGDSVIPTFVYVSGKGLQNEITMTVDHCFSHYGYKFMPEEN